MMDTSYDLCLAWNWEHDASFARLLDEACRARGVSLWQVRPANLALAVDQLNRGEARFRVLLDRASEEDARFVPLAEWVRGHGAHSVNPFELTRRAVDKATMHRAIFATIRTPYTIILPAHRALPDLPVVDLTPVGGQGFTVKPARGGGGVGVMIAADNLEQVAQARKQFPDDEYLLQTRVIPAVLDGRPAWFRMIYSSGEIFPCWWSSDSHRYRSVTIAEECHYGLENLRRLTREMARLCGLQLFSTEIALSTAGEFLAVDYANDPIDLRLQSQAAEGVPDEIVRFIAENLASLAMSVRRPTAVL
jgi:hypothetical protein